MEFHYHGQDEERTCPYCGKPMIQGYIQCRSEINWRKEPVIPVGASLSTDLDLASDSSLLEGYSVKAFRCEACRKIVVEYREPGEPLCSGESA